MLPLESARTPPGPAFVVKVPRTVPLEFSLASWLPLKLVTQTLPEPSTVMSADSAPAAKGEKVPSTVPLWFILTTLPSPRATHMLLELSTAIAYTPPTPPTLDVKSRLPLLSYFVTEFSP